MYKGSARATWIHLHTNINKYVTICEGITPIANTYLEIVGIVEGFHILTTFLLLRNARYYDKLTFFVIVCG